MTTKTLSVPGVHCNHCVHSIEGALGEVDGVDESKVDLDRKTVTVVYDDGKVQDAALVAAIEDVGYDVVDRPTLPTLD